MATRILLIISTIIISLVFCPTSNVRAYNVISMYGTKALNPHHLLAPATSGHSQAITWRTEGTAALHSSRQTLTGASWRLEAYRSA